MIGKPNKRNKRIILINYKFFLTILLFIPLYLFKNIYIKMLGSIFIVILLLLAIFDSIYRMDRIKLNKTWLWFILFFFYSTIMLIRTPTTKALYQYLLQIVLLFFISIFTTVSLDEQILSKIFKWGKILYFILLIPVSIIVIEGGRGAFGKFNNVFSPVIYKIMLPCTFFFIANSKHKPLKILLFSFIYFRMVERTSSIVLIIIYIVYLVLKKVKSSRILYKSIFIGTLIVIIGFVYGYVQLQYTEVGYIINNTFREYTGGNFFSGRNRIWEVAFNYIEEAPILGHGIDNGLLRLAGIELSTHNTYIHILLQGGLIGLVIFSMFMYSIWKSYFHYLDNDIVIVAAAYLIGILIFINFEVTLIGNSVVTAIFLWLVLGVGLIECNNIKINKKEDK